MISIETLPPDMQRKIIDFAIKEKTDTIKADGEVYTLPNIIQITYYCKKCNVSFPMRIFTPDLLENNFNNSIKCSICHKWITIYYKSVSISYNLIESKSTKKLLMKYIEEDR